MVRWIFLDKFFNNFCDNFVCFFFFSNHIFSDQDFFSRNERSREKDPRSRMIQNRIGIANTVANCSQFLTVSRESTVLRVSLYSLGIERGREAREKQEEKEPRRTVTPVRQGRIASGFHGPNKEERTLVRQRWRGLRKSIPR